MGTGKGLLDSLIAEGRDSRETYSRVVFFSFSCIYGGQRSNRLPRLLHNN